MISATPQRQFRAVAAFELVPAIAGGFAVLVGVLVLIGWWRDIEALRTIVPGLIAMIPNTAVACIMGGIALVLVTRTERSQRFRSVGRAAFAYALTALGVLFFFERARASISGSTFCCSATPSGRRPWLPPGRPAINSTIIMVVDGLALLLIDFRHAPRAPTFRSAEHDRRIDRVHGDRRIHVRGPGAVQLRASHGHGAAHGHHALRAEHRRAVRASRGGHRLADCRGGPERVHGPPPDSRVVHRPDRARRAVAACARSAAADPGSRRERVRRGGGRDVPPARDAGRGRGAKDGRRARRAPRTRGGRARRRRNARPTRPNDFAGRPKHCLPRSRPWRSRASSCPRVSRRSVRRRARSRC